MVRLVNLVCVAVLCVFVAACGGAKARLAAHLQRGQTYFEQGNYLKADVEFRNAMQIAPGDTTARLMAAKTAERLGKPGPAVGLYQSVVESNPDNVEARTNLARLYIFGGAPAKGLEVIKPALAAHPEDAVLLTLRAAARMELKDTAGATEDVEHALRLAPNNQEAVAMQAGLLQKRGDLGAAVALAKAAVAQAPNSTDLREVLVQLYLSGRDTDQAEAELLELVRLKPANVRYRISLASFYSQAGRTDDAQHALEEAVKAMPGNDDMKLALVDFTVRSRTPADGERVLRALVAKEPDNNTLRLALGTLLEDMKRSNDAVAVYEEVIRRAGTGPQGLTAQDRLAAIALDQGRPDEASKRIAEVLAKNPRDADALVVRGRLALDRHDATAAIADFRAVVRDQPKAIAVYQLLAQAHIANKELPLAVEALRNAVAAAPTQSAPKLQLAELLAQTEGQDAAISMLEDSVRAAPTDPALREALTSAYLRKGDYANALTAAQGLETLRPDAVPGYYLAGLAFEGQRRYEDARKEFEQALSAQPGTFEALSSLARLEVRRGHAADAIALVKKEIARSPKAAAPVLLLGQLYLGQKDAPAAVATLTQATELAPQWWVPYRELARARSASGDVAGAISAYQAGIKVESAEPLLTAELAGLYLQQGRADDAIAAYEAFSRQHPHVQVIENNLAMLLVTYRKDQESLDRARDLTAGFSSTEDGSLLDTSGWVHFKRAEYKDALPVLERAVARSPQSPEIRYHLGMAELQSGQKDRARSNLETAVSGSAKFTGVDEARSTLEALKKG